MKFNFSIPEPSRFMTLSQMALTCKTTCIVNARALRNIQNLKILEANLAVINHCELINEMSLQTIEVI